MAEGVKRKISAILSADVVGYSKLMEADEEATVRTIGSYRKTVSSLIEQHDGRVIDSPGDNVLSEFGSVVNAVQCAVEIQHIIRAKNAGLPGARKMEFRIGINLGDVIEEDDRTYGEGVNIASRIEGIADAGGICISESAYQQIKRKLSFGYEDLGEHSLKNITDPIRVYRIPIDTKPVGDPASGRKPPGRKWHILPWALVGLLAIVIGFLAVPRHVSEPPVQEVEETEAATPDIPEKPSIAVMPFDNLSNDPEQEYFVDGVIDEIITKLSMAPLLTVIARNSTFYYKGKQAKLQQISRELNARYIVEGSIRKTDSRIRITAQLIDAETEGQLWAETYERELQDVFNLQDEIAQEIVSALTGGVGAGLMAAEQARVRYIPTDDLTAYDAALKGMSLLSDYQGGGRKEAEKLFERAIELDPGFALAYMALGSTYQGIYIMERDPKMLDRAYEFLRKAVSLEDSVFMGHAQLANNYRFRGQIDVALAETERAISINPNDAWAYVIICSINNSLGEPMKALAAIEKAIQLNPHHDVSYLTELAWAYNGLGRYKDAIASLNRAIAMDPDYAMIYMVLAGAYQGLGWYDKAVETLEEALRQHPESADIRVQLMAAYRELGRYDETIALATDGLEQNPDWVQGHSGLAWTYLKQWQMRGSRNPQLLDRAVKAATRALDSEQDPLWGLYPLSAIYLANRQYDEAIAQARKMIELSPENDHGYEALANAYSGLGKYHEAVESLNEGIARSPYAKPLHLQLALTYIELWKMQQGDASQILKKALDVSEKCAALDKGSLWYLSYFHLQQRQYEQSMTEAEKLLSGAPEHAPNYGLMALIYGSTGRTEKATEMAEKGIELNTEFPVPAWYLNTLAQAYRLTGSRPEGIAARKRVLDSYVSRGDALSAHVGLAIQYLELDRMEEAKAEAVEILKIVPHFSVETWGERNPMQDRKQVSRDMAALRKAGLK